MTGGLCRPYLGFIMYKALMPFSNGTKIYKAGDDVSDHPRLRELIKRGLVKEVKTVKPDETKSTKPTKQAKQPNKRSTRKSD